MTMNRLIGMPRSIHPPPSKRQECISAHHQGMSFRQMEREKIAQHTTASKHIQRHIMEDNCPICLDA